MKKTITVCDGCGREIKKTQDRYHMTKLVLETDTYCDAAGDTDYDSIGLEFCSSCTRFKLLPALMKIAGMDNEI